MKIDDIITETCAGAVASVAMPLGSGNTAASIYGPQKKKKKKKKSKMIRRQVLEAKDVNASMTDGIGDIQVFITEHMDESVLIRVIKYGGMSDPDELLMKEETTLSDLIAEGFGNLSEVMVYILKWVGEQYKVATA